MNVLWIVCGGNSRFEHLAWSFAVHRIGDKWLCVNLPRLARYKWMWTLFAERTRMHSCVMLEYNRNRPMHSGFCHGRHGRGRVGLERAKSRSKNKLPKRNNKILVNSACSRRNVSWTVEHKPNAYTSSIHIIQCVIYMCIYIFYKRCWVVGMEYNIGRKQIKSRWSLTQFANNSNIHYFRNMWTNNFALLQRNFNDFLITTIHI